MAWALIPDLAKGLNLDATGEELELGYQTGGSNIRFRNGFAERFKGMGSILTPDVIPYHIGHFQVGNTRNVMLTGLQKTYAWDGTTATEITNSNNTGTVDDRWCGFVFNGLWIQNNGVDVPQYWNGDTGANLADLTAWPSGYKVGFMRALGTFLVTGDVTRSGVRERSTMLWGDSADAWSIPGSWNIADATKDAGDYPLAETGGTIIDMAVMGSYGVIYKDDSLFLMQPIQGNAIFRFQRLPGDTGMLARGCVVNTPAGHVFLTSGLDLVVHSGQGLRSLIDGKMLTWLQNNINESNAIRSFLSVSPQTKEVFCCFPADSAAACTKAIVWNWKDDTLTIRDIPNATYGSNGQTTYASSDVWSGATTTWATDASTWSEHADVDGTARLLFSTTAPKVLMAGLTEQDAGADFTATLERTGLHLGRPEVMKWVRGVRPKIDAAQGVVVKVQVGWSSVPDASPTWSTAVDFTVGTDIECFPDAQAGRFLAIRLYTTSATPWRIRSCQWDIVDCGAY